MVSADMRGSTSFTLHFPSSLPPPHFPISDAATAGAVRINSRTAGSARKHRHVCSPTPASPPAPSPPMPTDTCTSNTSPPPPHPPLPLSPSRFPSRLPFPSPVPLSPFPGSATAAVTAAAAATPAYRASLILCAWQTETFGAFVKLDGYRKHGLVHCSQMAAYRVEDVTDVCKVGDQVFAKVGFLGGGGGGYSFVACRGHLTIAHASLSRRSTLPAPSRDTSLVWAGTSHVWVGVGWAPMPSHFCAGLRACLCGCGFFF